MTFLRNHRDVIAGMGLFVVPTVRFRLLYVWFAIDHGRRRILHFNVTENPTSRWIIRQLRETFPNEPEHRFLICDNDARPTQSRALRQSVDAWNLGLLLVRELSVCRVSEAFTTDMLGAKPLDQQQ